MIDCMCKHIFYVDGIHEYQLKYIYTFLIHHSILKSFPILRNRDKYL